jgi:hypothetical protein
MYSVTDFLDVKRREISDRLKEIKPLVEEYSRLEAAASALAGLGGSAPATAAARRKKGPGRPRGSVNRASKATAASTPTASTPAASTPAASTKAKAKAKAGRKKVGRPPGSGKKVGRPAGTGKKVGRPPGSGKKVGRPAGKVGRPKGRGGRRKGSGTRAAQALSFVQGQPGITIPELAAKMGIKQNYLYRVLPGLEQEGKLEKKGRGWHPKAA